MVSDDGFSINDVWCPLHLTTQHCGVLEDGGAVPPRGRIAGTWASRTQLVCWRQRRRPNKAVAILVWGTENIQKVALYNLQAVN